MRGGSESFSKTALPKKFLQGIEFQSQERAHDHIRLFEFLRFIRRRHAHRFPRHHGRRHPCLWRGRGGAAQSFACKFQLAVVLRGTRIDGGADSDGNPPAMAAAE